MKINNKAEDYRMWLKFVSQPLKYHTVDLSNISVSLVLQT